MFKKHLLITIVSIVLIFSFTAAPLNAVLGDCNGDGFVMIQDAVALIQYILMNGPQPANMIDCDCDGFPGVNYGDILQIIGYLFVMQSLYPVMGTDIPVASDVMVYCQGRTDGIAPNNKVQVMIDLPPYFVLAGFTIPLSFEAEYGQAQVTCDSVSYVGSVGYGYFAIDNPNERVTLHYPGIDPYMPPTPAGSKGLMCTIYFSQVAPGDPNDLEIVSTERIWPMLFALEYYAGTDRERVFLPRIIDDPIGDVNCDNMVNVSDAVYTINYIFVGGNAPGDCEQ